jgi:hypothetical protein
MSMPTKPCLDCGQTLTSQSPVIWNCANAACPGGVAHHLCGYCKEPTFSPVRGTCSNPACRTHAIPRGLCPVCRYQAVLTLEGYTFCLNRNCATHRSWIAACPTCAQDSLIELDGVGVCVKSTCVQLLKVVPWTRAAGTRRGKPVDDEAATLVPGAPPAKPSAPAPATALFTREPGYVADGHAATVVPGARRAVDDSATTVTPGARPGYLADADATTVIPGAKPVTLHPMGGTAKVVDDEAPTLVPGAKPVVPPPGFHPDAETVVPGQLPKADPASKAETVLSPPRMLPPSPIPKDFDENAETFLPK